MLSGALAKLINQVVDRKLLSSDAEEAQGKGHFEIKGDMFKLPDEYIQNYEVAIMELSKDRPLLAAELRGTEKFHKMMEVVFSEFFKSHIKMQAQVKKPFFDSESLQMFASAFAKRIVGEFNAFDKQILRVASNAGMRRKTRKLLKEKTLQGYMFAAFDTVFSAPDKTKEFHDTVLKELTAANIAKEI